MFFANRCIIPAVNNMKDFEKSLEGPYETIVILDSHIAQVGNMVRMAKRRNKNVFLHADLIHGLKNDLYAAEFICQNIRPDGLISTHSEMLNIAKKRGLATVLRFFLLDSRSIETSYRQLEQVKPDMVEVLPGLIDDMIREIGNRTGIPVVAGGLIRTREEIRKAFAAGAVAVSTSDRNLWTVREHVY
ncbi:glycerol-3-phosphate responsive antiterminator [Sporolactobacillus vineae]|uniref:glycerol-3-phosphate responsive antiterminator n=1 Tax=Sporolactobacillus vineae TaxID=444463 RepID=UPI000287EB6B|nr:glycerol-3-phosphate responsive antiterminator [Sporolactobacillus vineae]